MKDGREKPESDHQTEKEKKKKECETNQGHRISLPETQQRTG
jgi:hypothetical protein